MSFDPENFLSPVIRDLPPWGIGKFFDLLAQSDGIVSLALGEPNHAAPAEVLSAAITSLQEGETKYSSNYGIIQLRQAIAAYQEERFQVGYDPEKEIIVTIGGSQALDLGVRTIIAGGDEVMIPTPCYASYEPCVAMAGGRPVRLPTREEDGYRVTAALLEEHLTPATKALLLNYPNNPTGAVMRREDLEPVAEFVRRHNLMVISDEIYAEFTYGASHCSIASLPGMRDRTLLINGFSKSFALTGLRIGYLCAHRSLIPHMIKIHQCNVLCLPVVVQRAAMTALTACQPSVRQIVAAYDRRRKVTLQRLQEMGLPAGEPGGAFYIFPSIRQYGLTSEEFARRLLFEGKVAVIPGNVFGPGGEGHIRCAYTVSDGEMATALDRMASFCAGLS